MQNDTLKDWML